MSETLQDASPTSSGSEPESAGSPSTDGVLTVWRPRAALAPPRSFPRTSWGHRGYEEESVDRFVQQVLRDLGEAEEEIDDLRAEVDRLHRYIRRQWAAVAAAEAAAQQAAAAHGTAHVAAVGSRPPLSAVPDPDGPSPLAQARAVLAQAQDLAERRAAEAHQRLADAQRAAERRIGEAEEEAARILRSAEAAVAERVARAEETAARRLSAADAMAEELLARAEQIGGQRRRRALDDVRRLLLLARARHEESVVRAHERADLAAESALHDLEVRAATTNDPARSRAELHLRSTYLRTVARVNGAALRATLDTVGREFDRLLDELEEHAADRVEPVAGAPARVLVDVTQAGGAVEHSGTDQHAPAPPPGGRHGDGTARTVRLVALPPLPGHGLPSHSLA